jgi:hypothetical protein
MISPFDINSSMRMFNDSTSGMMMSKLDKVIDRSENKLKTRQSILSTRRSVGDIRQIKNSTDAGLFKIDK